MSRPGFWNPVSEGIRQANPVLVTNYFKEKFYKKKNCQGFKVAKWQVLK